MSVVGKGDVGDRVVLSAGPDSVASYKVYVEAPREAVTAESMDVTFTLVDRARNETATRDTVFRGPQN